MLIALAVWTTPAPASTITAGEQHSCAIRTAGSMSCWGGAGMLGNAGGSGSLVPAAVDGLSTALDIAGSYDHTCAVLAGGTVDCWGINFDGQLGDGTTNEGLAPVAVNGLSDATAVATGLDHSCAIRVDGTVRCWGSSSFLGGGTGNGVQRAVSISAGAHGTCVAKFAGGVDCWGTVTPPPAITDAQEVAVGYNFACALRTGGTVICWGNNFTGALGLGNTDDITTFVDIPGLTGVTQIAAGWDHACALLTGGTVKCWGRNFGGQLGDGGTADHYSPATVPGLSGVTDLAAGQAHTCARLTTGALDCWGGNVKGQLGNGLDGTATGPVTVTGAPAATALAGGLNFYCAVVGGPVKCWGQNDTGQLGDGTFEQRPAPVPVTGISTATAIAAGTASASHSCALLSGGSVSCWGDDSRGELGDGLTANRATPAVVPGVSASRLGVGRHQSCVVTTDATPKVVCWGDRWHDGGRIIVAAPTEVTGTNTATDVAVGEYNACALLGGGSVVCWGVNDMGELGDGGGPFPSNDPVAVIGITTATAIKEINNRSTCALVSGPAVKCWGEGYGNAPVTVAGTTFPASNDQCTLSAGTVTCTGSSLTGVLGDGFQPAGHFPVQPAPAAVGGLSDVREGAAPPRVTPSAFTVTPTSLTFPETVPGVTGDGLAVTVTNTTSGALPTYFAPTAPEPAADFEQKATTCGGSLPAGGTCTVSYVFHPSLPGARTGTAGIGLAGATVTVNLAGTGLTGFTVAPKTTTFPSTLLGATSTALPVTIINVSGSTKTLDLLASGLGDDFGATNDCGATLGPGSSCTLSVTFHPTAAGTRTANPSVRLAGTDNAFTVTGTGTAPSGPSGPSGPSNAFTIDGVKVKKRNRLTVSLTFPAAGSVQVVTRAKIKRKKLAYTPTRTRPVSAGQVTLKLKPSRKVKAALKKRKRGKVSLSITFTPTGGTAATLSRTVKIKR